MAIHLTDRPDLEARTEEKAQVPRMTQEAILESLKAFGRSADIVAAELADDPELDSSKPLSQALQDAIYDEHGLPK